MLQGERSLARDNKTIGKFQLTDIPPAPRGTPQIEVAFDIDANGILNVSAKDLGTGKEQKITITASSGLSKSDIDKMQRDAELHAEEDKQKREEIEARNEADSAVYRSEKMLRDHAGKISDSDKHKISDAAGAVKDALKRDDAAAIKSAAGRLNEVCQSVVAEVYKSASAQPQANNANAGGTPKPEAEGDVIDAEVVDENK